MGYLLGISGALRAGSTNSMLIREAARFYEPERFIEADLRMPLYDGDLEIEAFPEEAQILADQIAGAEAIVISTPEYNKAPPGVLKNALDWVSRTKGHPWSDKPVAIMSSAAGRAGGERTQFALRLMLVPFRPRVLAGPEVMIAGAAAAFDDDGRLKDEIPQKLLGDLMDALRAEVARS